MTRAPRQPGTPAFERATSLGYMVNHLARLFARALETRLAVHQVTRGQFPILLILWEEEGVTQSEIARRLDIEQPTVANTLRRMDRDGLVTLAPDPNNRRHVLVGLTERGRALQAPLVAEAQAVNARAAAHLTAGEHTAFLALLGKIAGALQTDPQTQDERKRA